MRAEAFRNPNSDLNHLNASFGTDPAFRAAWIAVIAAPDRESLQPADRAVVDFYFLSLANVFEQLVRETKEGILDQTAIDSFGAQAIFNLPYVRASWPLYARALSEQFVRFAEARYGLSHAGDNDRRLWYGPSTQPELGHDRGGTSV
jgi:hypothetical protein